MRSASSFTARLDAVGGEELVVVGPVDPRRRVRLGAALLELAVEVARLEVLGLVEHQVLEEVREPRLAGLLVPRADVEPGVVRDDRRARVDEHEHREPVAEPPAMQRLAAEGDGAVVVELARARLFAVAFACSAHAWRVAAGSLMTSESPASAQDFFGLTTISTRRF